MHQMLANKRILTSRHSSKSRGTSTSRCTQYSSASHSTALSKTTSHGNAAALSTEEVDCFRSMRGTSITSASSLESAMSQDLTELDDRLDSIRRAGEREKKVFDKQGQAYSILVTHDEVRVCHMDEKGEYHYRHLPNVATTSGANSRRTSKGAADAEKPAPGLLERDGRGQRLRASLRRNNKAAPPKTQQPSRRQVVHDTDGRTLVDIAPDTVTVYHRGGVWRCHRFAGKIWDSDYATHVTAKMPRPWDRLRRRQKQPQHQQSHDQDDSDKENAGQPKELLLASNTPGEGGPPPRAYKSFYHNL